MSIYRTFWISPDTVIEKREIILTVFFFLSSDGMCTLTDFLQFVVNNLLCISKQKGADKIIDSYDTNDLLLNSVLLFDFIDGDLKQIFSTLLFFSYLYINLTLEAHI